MPHHVSLAFEHFIASLALHVPSRVVFTHMTVQFPDTERSPPAHIADSVLFLQMSVPNVPEQNTLEYESPCTV